MYTFPLKKCLLPLPYLYGQPAEKEYVSVTMRKGVLWQVKDEYLMIIFYFSHRFKNKNSSLQYTVAPHNLELYHTTLMRILWSIRATVAFFDKEAKIDRTPAWCINSRQLTIVGYLAEALVIKLVLISNKDLCEPDIIFIDDINIFWSI